MITSRFKVSGTKGGSSTGSSGAPAPSRPEKTMEPLLGLFLLFLRRKKQEEREEEERKDEKRKFAPSLIIFGSATERDRHPTVPF